MPKNDDEPEDPISHISHPKKRRFIRAFAEIGTISGAALRVGVSRRSHSNWYKEDQEYRTAFDAAADDYADSLEQVLDDLGRGGNVTALIFRLKGLRPEKYRERSLDVLTPGEMKASMERMMNRLRVKLPKSAHPVVDELLKELAGQ